jgi:hypothetical protein
MARNPFCPFHSKTSKMGVKMPTRAQKSLFIVSDAVSSVLGEDLMNWANLMQLSISHRPAHTSPNMAILCMIVRKSRNVSQMEFGRNLSASDGSVVFNDCDGFVAFRPESDPKRPIWTVDSGPTVSGYFSLIAHIEQGKSQTVVPAGFMQYVAKVLDIPVSVVESAYAEDVAIRAAFTASN